MDDVRCNDRGASGTSPASGSLSCEDDLASLLSFDSTKNRRRFYINILTIENHLRLDGPLSPSDTAPSSDALPSRFL